MQQYLILFCFLIISISHSILAKEQVIFSISSVEVNGGCNSIDGSYKFKFKGNFNGSPMITDKLIFKMESPSGMSAECTPYNVLNSLICEIDICNNPLVSAKLLLPCATPTFDDYKLENWEEIIGAKSGVSNLLEDNVSCSPSPENTFITSSIESKGCYKTANLFTIKGDWKDSTHLPEIGFDFKIEMANEKKDIASCYYSKSKTKQFECSFEGEGDIK